MKNKRNDLISFYQIISVILTPKLDESSLRKESYGHIKQTNQNL